MLAHIAAGGNAFTYASDKMRQACTAGKLQGQHSNRPHHVISIFYLIQVFLFSFQDFKPSHVTVKGKKLAVMQRLLDDR